MWPKRLLGNKSLLFFVVLGLAILIRIYGTLTPPQYYDMATFEAWGAHMLQVGPAHFYEHTWSDYLPLPLYTFAPILTLATWFHADYGIVFKIVMSLLELGLSLAIVRAVSPKKQLLLLTLLLFSPVMIGDTAFWGQVDTIPALLTLLSLVLLQSKKSLFRSTNPNIRYTVLSAILFGLAVAIKPIMLLASPVLWALAIQRGKWWQFPALAGTIFLVTGIPMAGLGTIQLLWARTLAQAGTYPFTTINAWNLWSIVPHLSSWPPDNQIVLGLSAHATGLILFGSMSLVLLNNWRKTSFSANYGYRVAASLLIIFYTCTTRMHERHLLFGLPLLTLAGVIEPWLLLPLTLLSATFTLNLYAAYYWVNHGQTWPFSPDFVSLISWVNVMTAFFLATVWHWPACFGHIRARLAKNKVLVGILLIATVLRIYGLAHPPVYIFDEVYHAFTAREYLHNHKEAWEWWTTPPPGVAYEWTHPPVAKYGMVLGMLLFGENSFGWRIGSAVAGVISIFGIYLLTKVLTKNRLTAHLAAFLVSIEGLHIAQSRIGMNDMYMLVFLIWALYAAVRSRWKGAALLYGLALASKWSAMYGVVPLALIYLHQSRPTWHPLSYIRYTISIIRTLLISALVYLLTFTPFITAGHTWAQLVELHRQMWYYHTHLVATHAYQSVPLQWIFSARPVWYYVNYGTQTGNIYAQGNPLILWLGLIALMLLFRKILHFRYTIFYILYVIFTVPWVFSPRIMFFYHYLPSATFLCVILALWLSTLSARPRLVLLICCVSSLLLLSPVFFGFPTPQPYWDILFKLFPSWK